MNKMTYEQAIEYIEQAAVRGSHMGLERVRQLSALAGNVHDKIRCIHVAGTNGKGSTSCFIASILISAGYKVGQYYSPAMTGTKDHYMINGNIISDEEYALCVSAIKEANDSLHNITGEDATQFELETVLAFYYFAMKECDIVVLETGLGGRDDATNICTHKDMCVFTSVSLDHTAILGDTLTQIASVKSGIITSACPVVAYDSGEAVTGVLKKACEKYDNSLYIVSKDSIVDKTSQGSIAFDYESYRDVAIGHDGWFQMENASVAIKACTVLKSEGYNISDEAIYEGIKHAYWPFRFEKISDCPVVYVDGAHNPDAADKLYETVMHSKLRDKKLILVLGMFKDKDYEYVIGKIASLSQDIYCITVPNIDRALYAECIRDTILNSTDLQVCKNVVACDTIQECVERIMKQYHTCEDKDNVAVLACGSLSYLSVFKQQVLEWRSM